MALAPKCGPHTCLRKLDLFRPDPVEPGRSRPCPWPAGCSSPGCPRPACPTSSSPCRGHDWGCCTQGSQAANRAGLCARGETLASWVICRACGLVLPSINQVQGGSEAGEDPGRALGTAGDRAQQLAVSAVSVGSCCWSAEPRSRAKACAALRSDRFHLCSPRLLTLRTGHLGRRKGKGREKDGEGQKARRTEGEGIEKVIEQASSSQSDSLPNRHPRGRTKCGSLGTTLLAPRRSREQDRGKF